MVDIDALAAAVLIFNLDIRLLAVCYAVEGSRCGKNVCGEDFLPEQGVYQRRLSALELSDDRDLEVIRFGFLDGLPDRVRGIDERDLFAEPKKAPKVLVKSLYGVPIAGIAAVYELYIFSALYTLNYITTLLNLSTFCTKKP